VFELVENNSIHPPISSGKKYDQNYTILEYLYQPIFHKTILTSREHIQWVLFYSDYILLVLFYQGKIKSFSSGNEGVWG